MEKGFTLIEIMVAVSIFAIVTTVTTGALITVSDVNRKAQAIKVAMDNVSFAMDNMVLNLREGANFGCLTGDTDSPSSIFSNASAYLGDSCAKGGGIIFISKRSVTPVYYIYRFKADVDGSGIGGIQIASSISSQYTNLTSPEVNITGPSFFSVPDAVSFKRPTVTMVISGEVPGKNPAKFNLQTTAMANF